MLYTSSLLDTYLQTSTDPQTLGDLLTLKTCEVEEIHTRQLPDDVVIGYVTSTASHPDADKLTVCQVDCGSKGSYQICCGASNVRAGIFVVVALPGCFLPAIHLKIEPRELRGEASNGMICSKEELGIGEDLEQKWIRALAKGEDAATTAKGEIETVWDLEGELTKEDIGTPLGEKFPYLNSWTLDVENKTITHRPELFGHFGLATEIASIASLESRDVTTSERYTSLFESGQTTDISARIAEQATHDISVNITSALVSTYNTILIRDITQGTSPLRTRLALMELGLQPRSTRVDLSNIFMYLTGQPIHFFDADKISGTLVIRQAKADERFVDLFDKEHTLTPDDIVISDDEKICALAGIVGSNTSGIDDTTKHILAEVANFDPVQVRKTGTRLGLRTDAEIRFEKTINPHWTLICTRALVDQLSDSQSIPHPSPLLKGEGVRTSTISGISSRTHPDLSLETLQDVSVDRSHIAQIMGDSEKKQVIEQTYIPVLESLGFLTSRDSGLVTIPARRSPDDIEREVCIIEEIARIQGFDTIESQAYHDRVTFVPFSDEVKQKRALETLLIDKHNFDQVETYPWILNDDISLASIDISTLYEMENPLTPEQTYLRPTIIWSLLASIEKNVSFFDDIALFDIGHVWNSTHIGEDTASSASTAHTSTGEHTVLGLGLCSTNKSSAKKSHTTGGSIDIQENLFLKAKSLIEHVLATCEAKGRLQYISTAHNVFHPLQQANITLNGKPIGSIQTLHPYIAVKRKLTGEETIILCELDLTLIGQIASAQKAKKKGGRSMSTYETLQDQIVWRDLSFVIDHDSSYGDITGAVRKVKEVVDVEIFDLYAGEHIGEGKKSIGVRMKIAGDTKQGSMTTDQINDVMDRAIKSVEKAGGVLR